MDFKRSRLIEQTKIQFTAVEERKRGGERLDLKPVIYSCSPILLMHNPRNIKLGIH
jgi:hypothetical protein